MTWHTVSDELVAPLRVATYLVQASDEALAPLGDAEVEITVSGKARLGAADTSLRRPLDEDGRAICRVTLPGKSLRLQFELTVHVQSPTAVVMVTRLAPLIGQPSAATAL